MFVVAHGGAGHLSSTIAVMGGRIAVARHLLHRLDKERSPAEQVLLKRALSWPFSGVQYRAARAVRVVHTLVEKLHTSILHRISVGARNPSNYCMMFRAKQG